MRQQTDDFNDCWVRQNLVKDVMFWGQNWSCEEMFNLTQINDLLMQCNANAMSRLQHNVMCILFIRPEDKKTLPRRRHNTGRIYTIRKHILPSPIRVHGDHAPDTEKFSDISMTLHSIPTHLALPATHKNISGVSKYCTQYRVAMSLSCTVLEREWKLYILFTPVFRNQSGVNLLKFHQES